MQVWQLTTVISGGQTGADQAGLAAAKFLDYRTGGRCPKGYLTELGAEPWLREFGLVETSSPGYRSRTLANVQVSDGTVIFTPAVLESGPKAERKKAARAARIRDNAREATLARWVGHSIDQQVDQSLIDAGLTGGSLHTARMVVGNRKHLIVDPATENDLRTWIAQAEIKTLNVAGARESRAPGMFRWVYDFLVEALVPF